MGLALAIPDSCCPKNLGDAPLPGEAILIPGESGVGGLGFLGFEARLLGDQ